jgi:superfamily I DNA/RNA helicase
VVEQIALTISSAGIDTGQIAILCHSKRIVKHWKHLSKQGYYVATFNQMKGLEFRAVLIPHLNTVFDQHDTPKDDTFVGETRRRVFTAMTRARETLVLSYHGTFPQELAPINPYVQYENSANYG